MQPFFHFSKLGYFSAFCIGTTALCAGGIPKINRIKVSTSVFIAVLLIGVAYGVSALLFYESGRAFIALCFILIIPFCNFFLIKDSSKLIFLYGYCYGNLLTLPFILIISAIFVPIADEQYSSIMLNPNGFAFMVAPSIGSALVLLLMGFFSENGIKSIISKIWIYLSLGQAITFVFLSRSRTVLLAGAFELLFFTIYILICTTQKKKLFCCCLGMALSVLLMFNITIRLFPIINEKAFHYEAEKYGKLYYFTMLSYEENEDDAELYLVSNAGRKKIDAKTVTQGLMKRVEKGKNGEDVSSGRFAIWKAAWNEMNWKGHSSDDVFYNPHGNYYTSNTHNVILTIGYQTGWLGFVSIVFFVFAYLRNIFIQLYEDYRIKRNVTVKSIHFYIYINSIIFAVIPMLSGSFVPTSSMMALGFWMSVFFLKEINDENEKTHTVN